MYAFFTFLQLRAGSVAQAQGQADGKNVDNGQLQKTGHHRRIKLGIFLSGNAQYAVGHLSQRRIIAGQRDNGCAVFFGNTGRVQQLDG